jgi:hypothetical protein
VRDDFLLEEFADAKCDRVGSGEILWHGVTGLLG